MLNQLIYFALLVSFGNIQVLCDDTVYISLDEDFEICSDNEVFDISNINIIQKDEKNVVLDGTVEIKKALDSPMKVRIYIEKKEQGKWTYAYEFAMGDFCEEMQMEDEPWTGVIQKLPEAQSTCPIEVGTATLDEVPVGDLQRMKSTISRKDVGLHKAHVTMTALVDGDIQEVVCMDLTFEVKDADNK